MKGKDLLAFRLMVGLSQKDMAHELGYGRRNYQMMEKNMAEIRACVGLACAAYALGIRTYDGPAAEACWHNTKRKRHSE